MSENTPPLSALTLHGFNNLSKTLSLSLYDVCYAHTSREQNAYITYLDEVYDADRLTSILTDVSDLIGAHVLNIARQDYEPQGASVTILICEEPINPPPDAAQARPGPLPSSVVGHLDKSHLTVHTYPESHPDNGIATFRVDIEVSTCGRITPLRALNYLIHSFEPDVITLDYRVRGFTRDIHGRKHFIDHDIDSIQQYLAEDSHQRYQMLDANVPQENLFHTRMKLNEFDLDHYLFDESAHEHSPSARAEIAQNLKREIAEIFHGRNLT
ncbi:MAG TPA: adenosylmethionine decarboxylase [Halothiobacillaceae bacterium]|nr:adenosylmethionine decarboxylase [Halothiobacillaceae bacterium]